MHQLAVLEVGGRPTRPATPDVSKPSVPAQRTHDRDARATHRVGPAVLVVEDDPANAKLLHVVLRAAGWDARVATSAEHALEVLQTFRPRAIVIDLVLPSMSGLVLAERLKSDPATNPIVLVAMTALRGPGAERLALEVGCTALLESPVDALTFPEVLLARIENAR